MYEQAKGRCKRVLSGSCNLTWTYSTKLDNQEEAQRDPRLAGKEAAHQRDPRLARKEAAHQRDPRLSRKEAAHQRDPRLSRKEAAYQGPEAVKERGSVSEGPEAARERQGLLCKSRVSGLELLSSCRNRRKIKC